MVRFKQELGQGKRRFQERGGLCKSGLGHALGKFDGVLLASDFDNTLLYTADALRTGAPLPPLPEETGRSALRVRSQPVILREQYSKMFQVKNGG